ncbi:hypothetical protein ACLOJK_035103 [Asimina triloba]
MVYYNLRIMAGPTHLHPYARRGPSIRCGQLPPVCASDSHSGGVPVWGGFVFPDFISSGEGGKMGKAAGKMRRRKMGGREMGGREMHASRSISP